MAGKGTVRKRVFVSYSHADAPWLKRLQVHMRPLVRDAEVTWWDDTMIKPGADWRSEIEHALASAKVAVLLVSADFLASDFIANDELPKLLKAAEDEGAKIIPLILSPSRFTRIPSLARFQAVNPPDRPLAGLSRSRREEVLAQAAEAIENALTADTQASQELRGNERRAGESPQSGKPAERAKKTKAPRAKTRAATPRPVRASIEQGPVLHVQPAAIDFGQVTAGETARAAVAISNKGSGDLTWKHQTAGDFFSAKRTRDRLTLTLTGEVGDHLGSLWISGNGGDATVVIRAKVVAAKPPRRATTSPAKPRQPAKTQAQAPAKKRVRAPTTRKRPSPSAGAAFYRAGARIADRYEVQSKLGGGMTDVYLAQDQELGRRVAVKLFDERYANNAQFVTHFRREALNAAALSHPNIVSIYDRGETNGSYFIVMEYVEGRTLEDLIRSRGPCPIPIAIAYTRQILAALRYAHRNGVIHGDIRSDNLIVDKEGRVKVAGFGIARAGASEMTEDDTIIGTAQYLSPEQARGAPVDQRSDLYSTGIVLYELLTGNVPFTGEAAVEIAMKHLMVLPKPPSELRSEIPQSLDLVVLRALGKEPDARFQDAQAMDLALKALASDV